MTVRVHPSAVVHDGAILGDGVEIGPFCEVGPHVVLEDGVRLKARSSIVGHARIGARTVIHEAATLGGAPQVTGYEPDERSRLETGPDCVFRECVTVHAGTPKDAGTTRIGARCYFMAYSHAGHDCQLGEGCMLANSVAMAGHCRLGPNVTIGGAAAIHQHTYMGEGAMIAGGAVLVGDVIPYGMAQGHHARLHGLNLIGLKRRGAGRDEINTLRAAYREIFEGPDAFDTRVDAAEKNFADSPKVMQIIEFIRRKRKRALCRARAV